MNAKSAAAPAFTGRHMLLIMVAFFGVIVTVNVTMAVLANRSWTGLVVPNSYVASQHFNEDTAEREAMLALGYKLSVGADGNALKLALHDKSGAPLQLMQAKASLTHIGAGARQLEFSAVCAAGVCTLDALPRPGLWKGDITLNLADGSRWRQAVAVTLKAN